MKPLPAGNSDTGTGNGAPLESPFLVAALDAIPVPIFVVNEQVEVLATNRAAAALFGGHDRDLLRLPTGKILHCMNASTTHTHCGREKACKECVISQAVRTAVRGTEVVRSRCRMQIVHDGAPRDLHMLVTASPYSFEGQRMVLLVLEDMSELIELKALLPICAGCKKIRDDQQYWHHVEQYFQDHLDVQFSHGLCPDCIQKLYPQLEISKLDKASRHS